MQPMYSRQQVFFYMKLAVSSLETKGNLRFGFVFCFSVCIKKLCGVQEGWGGGNVRIGREK